MLTSCTICCISSSSTSASISSLADASSSSGVSGRDMDTDGQYSVGNEVTRANLIQDYISEKHPIRTDYIPTKLETYLGTGC